jgi:RNA polymerase sigma factor for flagellar operon FliA
MFKTYATYRIRGEILDYIRKEWKIRNPNYQRKVDRDKVEEKMLEMARNTLDEMGPRTDEERDAALQLSISNTAVVYLLSLESVENISEALQKDDISNEIIGRIERTNERVSLHDSLMELDENERKVIKMYYYENKSQIEISRALNMSKSKVSRLHMRILEKLKHKVSVKMNKEWTI